MSLRALAGILAGRRDITVARRTRTGLEHLVTGRLEAQEGGVLLVAAGDTLHRIHLHPGLVVTGGAR